jgi:putative glutamine amidotransferase
MPIIAVPTQTLEATDQLPRCWVMSQRYVRVLTASGAVPWLVPLMKGDERTLREIYDRCDGVFLPGGVDMDPSTYDEPPAAALGRVDPDRDWSELTLVRWAAADRKPVLAVCRGAQVMNVAAGGTLYQDLATEHAGIKHDYFPSQGAYTRDFRSHSVHVTPGSRLADLLGDETLPVNSMHHQGIKTLAPSLVVSAVAPDGVIEGVEVADAPFMVGVQWHPEDLVDLDPRMQRLFDAFVQAASRR